MKEVVRWGDRRMEVATSHEEKPNMVQEGGVQGRTMEGRVVKKWSVCRPSNCYVSNLDTYLKEPGGKNGSYLSPLHVLF